MAMPAKNKKIMRKIYLFLTSALLLLGSSTLWAATVATVDSEEFETIDAAISAWKASGKTTLTLLADCEYNAGTYVYPWGAKTLDLNGKKLTWNFTQNEYCFINEDGLSIEDSDSQHNGELIINAKWGIINVGSNSATTLNISNCKLSGTGHLILDNIGSVNIDNAEIASNSAGVVEVENGELNVTGKSIIQSSTEGVAIVLYGSVEDVANYSNLTIGKDVTVNAPNGWGIGIFGNDDASKAYGVVVNINGAINAKRGITINGNVNQVTGNVPVININDEAILNCSSVGADIYAAGYGIWTIGAATLNAATPIYAKSGVINIDGATIEACGAKADPQPNNNGFYSTGDAIVMDTNKSYAGAVLLNIYGDATIKSTNGYAIQEVITNGTTSSAAGIAITGDETMLAGGAGSVQMTDNFRNAMINGSSSTYEWILNGISGGVYSELPSVVADGYVAQEVEISGETYYKVVPKPEEPVAPASQTTYIINDSEWDYAVNLTNSSAIVVKTGATFKVKGRQWVPAL